MAKNGERVRRGTWTKEEDILLRKCIETYGQGNWHKVPLRAGLNRCRKSCRLRWMNYLRPTIKRGHFNKDEVDLILRLHKLIGNRWSLIAGRLPGRTANDIKNFWNSHIAKKLLAAGNSCKLKTAHDDDTVTKCNIIKPRPRKLTISKSQVLACPSEVNNYADEPNDENIKIKQPFSSASLSQEGPNDWTNSDGNDKKNEISDQSLSIEEVNECSHKWWSSLLGKSEIGEGTSFSFSDDY